MRLALLSDIHGNLPALQAVLADLAPLAVDAILVAGDLVSGPQPNEVIRLLRSANAWFIQGNNELDLLAYHSGAAPQEWLTHKQFALGRWIFRNVAAETVAWLRTLPEQAAYRPDGLPPIRVVHGSPRSPYEQIFPDRRPQTLDAALAQITETVMVCGHTHLSWVVQKNGKLALNPGSVGVPLDGDPRSRYALLTWQDNAWQPLLRAIPYDLSAIQSAFHTSGLLPEGGALAHSFLLSLQTGRNISRQFLTHAYRLAETGGYPNCKYLPDEIWDHAVQTFDFTNLKSPI